MALELGIPSLIVSGDSKLVINQLLKEYEVKKEDLVPYFRYATILIDKFDSVELEHVPREENRMADALANLAITLALQGEEEAAQAMDKAHSGVCGAHQSGPKLHFRIKRMGYYLLTMIKDCLDYAKRCQACQFHSNFIHQPPEPLHPTVASWPFYAWGLDVVGPLPKSSGSHLYILSETDYFSKWAEAAPLKEVKKETVVNFIKSNLIFRYGVPRYIITDNGKPFYNTLMDQLCTKFGFKQHNSSMYNAPTNVLVEAFNKTLCNLLKKVVAKSKKDWNEKIGEALWAYQQRIALLLKQLHIPLSIVSKLSCRLNNRFLH
ncbi:hypothetical protein RJ639_043279 [Escallonia herrerae]|uniref:Integrase catalytic domain-containing protein n=1 Tax=Escallonia herrerae TaxID=1293975 RepID=A0AA89B1U8_9ASTE|nr:hypothetical protein RJ639_043279 [Escallonia herrerae]